MGCGPGVYVQHTDLLKWKPTFDALQLTGSEVKKLYNIYRRVDADGSGSIECIELLTHIDVERTKFTERVFSIFDEDGSGEIDFREFILSLWNYCTLSKATLGLFAFDLYDRDSSGLLGVEEIRGMCADIYGRHYKTNPHARAIIATLSDGSMDDELDVEGFEVFTKTHQALLFPAFLLQQLLQKNTLGRSFWERAADKRVEVCKGKFVPMARFMEIHVKKYLYNEIVDAADAGVMDSKALQILGSTGTFAQRKLNATGSSVEKFIGLTVVKDKKKDADPKELAMVVTKHVHSEVEGTKKVHDKGRRTSKEELDDKGVVTLIGGGAGAASVSSAPEYSRGRRSSKDGQEVDIHDKALKALADTRRPSVQTKVKPGHGNIHLHHQGIADEQSQGVAGATSVGAGEPKKMSLHSVAHLIKDTNHINISPKKRNRTHRKTVPGPADESDDYYARQSVGNKDYYAPPTSSVGEEKVGLQKKRNADGSASHVNANILRN